MNDLWDLSQLTTLNITGWDYDRYSNSVSIYFEGDKTLYITSGSSDGEDSWLSLTVQ